MSLKNSSKTFYNSVALNYFLKYYKMTNAAMDEMYNLYHCIIRN